ncbi:MAG: hypothetical protein V5A38_03895 [Halolamina sp.]|uniref:hypothetical protein n=1 Tax=Halolamina sp. TaxID=1940283 RepID=UPI002FC39136
MGSDAIVDLDQEIWDVLAKYNLVLTALFGLLAVWVRTAPPANPESVLLVENGVLALLFGSIQTHAWISSCVAAEASTAKRVSRPARRSRRWASRR